MRRLIIVAFAILFTAGIANATEIPGVSDPKNAPTVWTESVYNGSGADITSGRVVVWDFDVSDSAVNEYDDMCPWVQAPTEADDIWTAGVSVRGRDIADGSTGQIIIKGPAFIEAGASSTVNQLVGATATTGVTVDYGAGTDDCSVGRVIKANSSGSLGSYTAGYALVFVDVSCSD